MRIEGDYLYPESPEEAMAFLGKEIEFRNYRVIGPYNKVTLTNVTTIMIDIQSFRISRTVACEALRYREGEPWCEDEDEMIVMYSSDSRDAPAAPINALHKRAIYLVNSANEFRDLSTRCSIDSHSAPAWTSLPQSFG